MKFKKAMHGEAEPLMAAASKATHTTAAVDRSASQSRDRDDVGHFLDRAATGNPGEDR